MNIPLFFITIALVFQILALQKVSIFGIPIYFLELCILGAIASSLWSYEWRGKNFIKMLQKQDTFFVVGMLMILFGASVSTFASISTSLTSIGQLKAWFFFPMLYFIWGVSFLSLESRYQLYKAWFIGTVLITFVALFGLQEGYITYDHRLAFPYTSPNFLAYLILPGVILGSYFLIHLKQRKERLLGALCLVLVLLEGYVLVQTQSYNVWMSAVFSLLLGAGLLLSLSAIHNKKKYWGGILLLLLLVASTLFSIVRDDSKWQNLFKQDGRSAFDSRLIIWEVATRLVRDNPILGIGVGNFQKEYLSYQEYFPPYLEWAVPEPHNLFLAFWLQAGIVGLLGFLLLVIRMIMIIFQKMWKSDMYQVKTEGVLILTLIFSFILYGIFDTPYFRNDLAFLFWTLMLLGVLYLSDAKEEND
jgi:O-antigen ligase